ncbi:MAG: TPM domain-containing protein [Pseudomonadota bacterium]
MAYALLRVFRPFWISLWFAALVLPALAQVAVPPLQARVTDLTGSLDAATRQDLESRLGALERAKGVQVAVLLLPTTRPEPIEAFALRVAETWKLGRQGVDDSLLLLVAKEDRAMRLEVGYGLEGAVPDAVAKRIISEIITPRFKEGDYAGGVSAGVAALERIIHGEPLPEPQARTALPVTEDFLSLAAMFVFVVGGILRALFGALFGALIAGSVAFLGAWFLLGSLGLAIGVGAVVFVLTLVGVSSMLGGGGGGGGYRGGGGGFGGGGASGRW